MVRKDPCSKPLTAKSRSRAEEALHDGTLILLERVLEMLVQQRLAGVGGAEAVGGRGAELDPQRDQGGQAGQPRHDGDPAVIARAAAPDVPSLA